MKIQTEFNGNWERIKIPIFNKHLATLYFGVRRWRIFTCVKNDNTNKTLFEIWSILNNPVLIASLCFALLHFESFQNAQHRIHLVVAEAFGANPISKGFVHYFVYLNGYSKWLICCTFDWSVSFYLYTTHLNAVSIHFVGSMESIAIECYDYKAFRLFIGRKINRSPNKTADV